MKSSQGARRSLRQAKQGKLPFVSDSSAHRSPVLSALLFKIVSGSVFVVACQLGPQRDPVKVLRGGHKLSMSPPLSPARSG